MCYLLLAAALVASVSGYIQLQPVAYEQLKDGNDGFTLDASTQNSMAWNDDLNILYVVAKEPKRLTAFTVSFTGDLSMLNSYTFDGNEGEPLDIEYCIPSGGGDARVAISFNDPTNPAQNGEVRLYRPAISESNPILELARQPLTVGPQPVDIKFTPDCFSLLVANSARPFQSLTGVTDGDGTVTELVIGPTISPDSTVTTTEISFAEKLDEQINVLRAGNYRTGGPLRNLDDEFLRLTQNLEPVSLEIAPNGRTAYVAMPKNNLVARLDLNLNIVSDIFAMGNRSWATFYMDASKADDEIRMENYRIFSTLQPRQIKWLVQDDTEWLVTLDSGYFEHIPEYNYFDYAPASVLESNDGFEGPDAELLNKIRDETRLGQAYVSTEDGVNNNEKVEYMFMFGGRGISVHDGQTLEIRTALVDNIERVSAQFHKEVFNTDFGDPSHTPEGDKELMSPKLGPNLSVLETGFFSEQKLLFLGSGSSGMIYIYVLVPDAECPQPFFHSVYRRPAQTSISWQQLYNEGTIGDLGITDMLYLGDSPDHQKILFVSSAISNSLSVYEVRDDPEDLRRRAAP